MNLNQYEKLNELETQTRLLQEEATAEYNNRLLATLSFHRIRFWLIRLMARAFGYLALKEKDLGTRSRYPDYFMKYVGKYCNTR